MLPKYIASVTITSSPDWVNDDEQRPLRTMKRSYLVETDNTVAAIKVVMDHYVVSHSIVRNVSVDMVEVLPC